MDMDLSPQFPQVFFEGEGGGYYTWSSSTSAVLVEAKVCAGKLVLKPGGIAFPHYADCSKFGYVLEGYCGVRLSTKGCGNYIGIQKGDVLPVPCGSTSWWYNFGETDVSIVFLGDSSKACVPGEISYFFLAGAMGALATFSPELVAKTFRLNAEDTSKLANSQEGLLIIKTTPKQREIIPKPSVDALNELVKNINSAAPDISVKDGGESTSLTSAKFPFLQEVGLRVTLLNLQPNAVRAPSYATSERVYYVAKGSGQVQIVGPNGTLVLDSQVTANQLFVVPRCFMAALAAGAEGMDCISLTKSTQPLIEELAGKDSVLNIIPPALQVSFNVSPELTDVFKRALETGSVIVPTMDS